MSLLVLVKPLMIERSDEGVSLFGFTLSGALRSYLEPFFCVDFFVGTYFYAPGSRTEGHDLF